VHRYMVHWEEGSYEIFCERSVDFEPWIIRVSAD
jgi:hypothetical protein